MAQEFGMEVYGSIVYPSEECVIFYSSNLEYWGSEAHENDLDIVEENIQAIAEKFFAGSGVSVEVRRASFCNGAVDVYGINADELQELLDQTDIVNYSQ